MSKKIVVGSIEQKTRALTTTMFWDLDELANYSKGVRVKEDGKDITANRIDELINGLKNKIEMHCQALSAGISGSGRRANKIER